MGANVSSSVMAWDRPTLALRQLYSTDDQDKLFTLVEEARRQLIQAGPCSYMGEVRSADQLDVVDIAFFRMGQLLDEFIHEEQVIHNGHVCAPEVHDVFPKLQFNREECWDRLLLPDEMFKDGVWSHALLLEMLRLAVHSWRTQESTPAMAACMRQGLRYFRYYWYMAGLSWAAQEQWESKVVAHDAPVVARIQKDLDAYANQQLTSSSNEMGRRLILGQCIPMAAIETYRMRKPKVQTIPQLDQLLPPDSDGKDYDQAEMVPEEHWKQMQPKTREAWRAVFFAQLLESHSNNKRLSVIGQYVVRWQDWSDPLTKDRIMQRAIDRRPMLPRILSYGCFWAVHGWTPVAWFVRAASFSHAVAIWIQAVNQFHFHRYEDQGSLPLVIKPWCEMMPMIVTSRSHEE